MIPVVEQSLQQANMTWDDIDAIAVTQGPGLLGSLLIGVVTARTLAWSLGKPLYPVHHILGHIYANWITKSTPGALGEEKKALTIYLLMNHTNTKTSHLLQGMIELQVWVTSRAAKRH